MKTTITSTTTPKTPPVELTFNQIKNKNGIYRRVCPVSITDSDRIVIMRDGNFCLFINAETKSFELLDSPCWKNEKFCRCENETITIAIEA